MIWVGKGFMIFTFSKISQIQMIKPKKFVKKSDSSTFSAALHQSNRKEGEEKEEFGKARKVTSRAQF